MTTTLFNYIRSELIKKGFDEFIDEEGNLVIFDEDHQFMTKILKYDDDVEEIVNNIFGGLTLNNVEHDKHFKKSFLYRFVNRRINRQTIESFKLELLSTFLTNEEYINRVYTDLDNYITQKNIGNSTTNQENKQKTDGETVSNNRSAFADLPQSSANLDVESTIMQYATDNTISKNKQINTQESDGTTNTTSTNDNISYQLDELFKTNGLLEQILNTFDIKCFLQVW